MHPSFGRFLPSNPVRSIGCCILSVILLLTSLSVVGASPEPEPGLLSSQMPSTYPTLWYVGIGATIFASANDFILLGFGIYRYIYPREREDSLRGVLDVLTRPFGERARSMRMNVGRVKVGEASVDDLRLRSSPALVPFSESQLCIYNTVDHSGEVFDIGDEEKCEALPALPKVFVGELGLFSLNPISFAIEPRFSSKA